MQHLRKEPVVLGGDVTVLDGHDVRLDQVLVRRLCHRRLGYVPR